MPAWLLNLLVSLAIKIGLPWVMAKFPWLPADLQKILTDLINDLNKPTVSNSVSRKKALLKVKELRKRNVIDGTKRI